jgi:hypothetical protein
MHLNKLFFIMLISTLLSKSIQAQTCNACFVATPDTNNVGLINLDASCSTPAFPSNLTYEWYADGAPFLVWPFPYYQIPFYAPGPHIIDLIVSDATTGCSDTSTQTVIIPNICTAQFQQYQFSNLSYFYSNVYSTSAVLNWDFGDGNTGVGSAPVHTYAAPGTYNVCLNVTDTAFGGCSASFCDSIVINSTAYCYAAMQVSYAGPGPDDYTADAQWSSYVAGNVQFIYSLNGTVIQQSSNPVCNFTLNQPLLNTLTLDIADTNGVVCSSTNSQLFATSNGTGCYACFYVTPLNLNGDSVLVDASCANVPAGSQLQWELDGIILAQTQTSFTQQIGSVGTHYFALRIIDSNSNVCDSMFQTIYVYAPPCQSCLTVTPVAGTTSDYTFDASCTGTGNYVYSWSVDNNFVSSGFSPVLNYSFTQSGTYNICISVSDIVTGNYCNTACTTVVVNTPTQTQFDLCGTIYKADINTFNYVPATLNEAMVYLVTLAPGGQLDAIDSTMTNASGQYCFNNKPIFDYRIKAALKPSSPDFANNLPTYFQYATMWYNANVITLANNNVYNKDVYMTYGVNTGGPGIITGNVLQGANKPSRSGALDGLSVILVDANTNDPIAYAKTQIGGSYTFQNVPVGDYKIYGELLNKNSLPASLTVTSSNTNFSNVNFEVNANVINPTTASPLSIVKSTKSQTQLMAYPNPANNTFELLALGANMDIQVFDMTGKRMTELKVNQDQSLKVSCEQWPAGLYWIKYTSGQESGTLKLSVK